MNSSSHSFAQSRVSCNISSRDHDCIRDYDCTSYDISRKDESRQKLIVCHWNYGRVQVARSGHNWLCRFDEIHQLEMRFTARLLGRGRRGTISGILRRTAGEGHATLLDFTTREVARESFRWRVQSLPLLVQITFRTLNLFRGRGCRLRARARIRRWNFCLAFCLPSILFLI